MDKPFTLSERELKSAGFASVESYDDLSHWIVQELDNALSNRSGVAEQVAYYWAYYNQERTRPKGPWADSADLTSPYATEFVDAILGRIMDTIMVDPLWIVEGWGPSASRAPLVEEFHQRAQEQERLQGYLREVLLRSLIEPAGILEVSENVDVRRVRRDIRAAVEVDEMGEPFMGEDGMPVLQQVDGKFVEGDDDVATAETTIDDYLPVRLGPSYDVVPYLDYVRFPVHARSQSEIWGYAKRFWRRVPELRAMAKRGVYDTHAVEQLGESDERFNDTHSTSPAPYSASQDGPTAQKELWEISLLADLDGSGDRWWLLTLSREHSTILRLQVDDRTTRFLEFVPFPKPGSRDGYSLIEKMMTLLEEDTALRNMRADRAALALGGTMKRLTGALWDPYEQPIGPGGVIDVRDMGEIQPLEFGDVPNSINLWKQDVRTDMERAIGLNDVALGTQSSESRTLGEIRLAAGYSEVRVKAIISAIQETLEELGLARHEIWKRVLAGMPEGVPAPQSLMQGLDARGYDSSHLQDSRITAEMLDGIFWFKPRGSVETANIEQAGNDFFSFLNVLPKIAAVSPSLLS
jgi:hypothetical protein